MFVLPSPGLRWLTAVVVGWLTLQALRWVTGVLPGWADLGSSRDAVAGAACASSAKMLSVRISLAAMTLGMAYMFVAMALGMSAMRGWHRCPA